jgi:hypothetical protein
MFAQGTGLQGGEPTQKVGRLVPLSCPVGTGFLGLLFSCGIVVLILLGSCRIERLGKLHLDAAELLDKDLQKSRVGIAGRHCWSGWKAALQV